MHEWFRVLFLLIFYIYVQMERGRYQSLKMLVLQPIHFEGFRGNLSFDLLLTEDFLGELIQDD